MRLPRATLVLALALLAALVSLGMAWRTPGNNLGYEPAQPIEYSHALHAGELKIACMYCHSGAERSRYAGIPAASVCMNCHRYVPARFAHVEAERLAAEQEKRPAKRVESPELRKLFDAMAFDEKMAPRRGQSPTPISWVRVHTLPDFVRFDHRPHVGAGVSCQSCHGPVESMARVRQFSRLSMGWCVNCHRDANEHGINGTRVYASLDCTACHR
jgi:hypothetical protein